MEFVKVRIKDLKPAEYNPRKALNPQDKEYQEIKKSIQEFGYVDPILVNADGTIIGGHQRYTVLKDLGYDEIEVTRVDLTKDQEKALNIALNKITGRWDSKLLKNLLTDLNEKKFDLSLTGFQPNTLQLGIRGDAEHTQKELVEGILNLEKAQFPGVGKYDIPEILPVYELPEIKEWIGFNYVLSDQNPEGKAVHFFIDDYQFERIWNNPDKYIEKLIVKFICQVNKLGKERIVKVVFENNHTAGNVVFDDGKVYSVDDWSGSSVYDYDFCIEAEFVNGKATVDTWDNSLSSMIKVLSGYDDNNVLSIIEQAKDGEAYTDEKIHLEYRYTEDAVGYKEGDRYVIKLHGYDYKMD